MVGLADSYGTNLVILVRLNKGAVELDLTNKVCRHRDAPGGANDGKLGHRSRHDFFLLSDGASAKQMRKLADDFIIFIVLLEGK